MVTVGAESVAGLALTEGEVDRFLVDSKADERLDEDDEVEVDGTVVTTDDKDGGLRSELAVV